MEFGPLHSSKPRVAKAAAGNVCKGRSHVGLNSIRSALRQEPFKPFDLCLADGRRVAVQHPEFVAMNKRIVIVTDEKSDTKVLLVTDLEIKPVTNGSRKKRRG